MHRTKISLMDWKGSVPGHVKRYGVFVDGELAARIVCIANDPVRWQCEDLTGKRISPTVFWRLPTRSQRNVIRQWVIDFFDTRAEGL